MPAALKEKQKRILEWEMKLPMDWRGKPCKELLRDTAERADSLAQEVEDLRRKLLP